MAIPLAYRLDDGTSTLGTMDWKSKIFRLSNERGGIPIREIYVVHKASDGLTFSFKYNINRSGWETKTISGQGSTDFIRDNFPIRSRCNTIQFEIHADGATLDLLRIPEFGIMK